MPDRLEAYVTRTDASKDSEIFTDLLRRVSREIGDDARIELSDYHSTAYGLTPQMLEWFSGRVQPARSEALRFIASQFQALQVKAVSGFWLEAEVDRVEARRVRDTDTRIKAFHEANDRILGEIEEAAREYETIKARHQREPVMTPQVLYVLGILGVLTLEVFLNFESFMKVPFITSPFLATGATGLVAIGIAVAGHIHGTLLKQYDWYFGPEDRTRFFQGVRLAGWGTLLLVIAMSGVLGARYYYILPRIQEALLLGTRPPSLGGSLSFMAVGNVLVYAIGAAWAFFRHDLDPEFPRAKTRLDRLKNAYDGRFNNDLGAEINRLRLKAEREIETLRQRHISVALAPGFNEAQDKAARLVAHDMKITSALAAYRAQLVDHLRKEKRSVAFDLPVPRVESGIRTQSLDAPGFLAHKLHLSLCI